MNNEDDWVAFVLTILATGFVIGVTFLSVALWLGVDLT
jgi:hypothetical protein